MPAVSVPNRSMGKPACPSSRKTAEAGTTHLAGRGRASSAAESRADARIVMAKNSRMNRWSSP